MHLPNWAHLFWVALKNRTNFCDQIFQIISCWFHSTSLLFWRENYNNFNPSAVWIISFVLFCTDTTEFNRPTICFDFSPFKICQPNCAIIAKINFPNFLLPALLFLPACLTKSVMTASSVIEKYNRLRANNERLEFWPSFCTKEAGECGKYNS